MTAALKVFSEKGFSEATNRDIAREAGLKSPGLIYHYFPSKLDLLRSIAEKNSPLTALTEQKDWLYSQPPEIALPAIANVYLTLFGKPEARPFMKLMLAEALKTQEFADTFAKIGPLRMVGLVAGYMKTQMDMGTLRPADPETAARCFVGPFVALFMLRVVFNRGDELLMNQEAMAREQIQIFLRGMAA